MARRKASDKFPLWLHPIGQWCKKHKGRPYYFGTDREAALKRYVNEWPDIVAGKARKRSREKVVTLADVVNSFLTEKRSKVESGELSERTWAEYYAVCDQVIDQFGRDVAITDLSPSDFAALRKKAAVGRGPVSVLNFVTRVRVLFKHACDFDLIEKPVKYGSSFSRPPKANLRLVRHLKAKRLIPAADLWKLIDGADPQLKCMILLALNGGMGSSDCAQLPRSALEQRPGWCIYPRPKTQVKREFPLWVETIEALGVVHPVRPAPKDPADDRLVFLTRLGKPWVRFNGDGKGKRSVIDSVAQMFAKLGERAGVKLPGGFYTLRHIHRTHTDEVNDKPAADLVMGHLDQSVTDYYREQVSDDRLRAVVNHVRDWLLASLPE